MLGLAAPRLLCLRQTHSTLKGTATAHRTRYMRDPCSLKDVQRCEKKRETNAKECEEWESRAKVCEAWEGARCRGKAWMECGE
jgi:hypothetical protein